MTIELAAIDGVGPAKVISLATESRERLDPGTGASFRAFLDPLPETPEAGGTVDPGGFVERPS